MSDQLESGGGPVAFQHKVGPILSSPTTRRPAHPPVGPASSPSPTNSAGSCPYAITPGNCRSPNTWSAVRQARGLTQSELAASAALSRDYVAQIEAGRSAALLEKLLRLLRRLGARVTITVDIATDREDDSSAQA
jgi:DNA-binding XRE family transcriptional regulator